jgi:hypothetical protein
MIITIFNSNIYLRNESKISKQNKSHIIQRRTMFKQATNNFYRANLNVVQFSKNMSTLKPTRLKKKAVQDLANDNTGKHTHIAEEQCINTDCEKKPCTILCNELKIFILKGHQTHKPPIGRYCRFVDDKDTKGEEKPQYFVPNAIKKNLTAKEKENYGKDIKTDSKQQSFVDEHRNIYEQD